MDQRISDQLEKVLALADSAHEGEAVVAVRKARQMLSKGGLSFGDLARAAASQRPRSKPFSFFSASQAHLETQIIQMRQKLDDLQAEYQAQGVQLEFWRRRAGEFEQTLNLSQADARRWRQLARETVEKLWDLGQSTGIEGFGKGEPESQEYAPIKRA